MEQATGASWIYRSGKILYSWTNPCQGLALWPRTNDDEDNEQKRITSGYKDSSSGQYAMVKGLETDELREVQHEAFAYH